jgi:hypothetical protein
MCGSNPSVSTAPSLYNFKRHKVLLTVFIVEDQYLNDGL